MAEIKSPQPVMLVMAVCSRFDAAFEWALQRAEETFGPTRWTSDRFDFDQTEYYAPSMGVDLKKQFLAFRQLIDPGQLRSIKRRTNQWESEFCRQSPTEVERPVNLDPGYISLGKLVLASTKDHMHRVYLDDGIFAEVTLHYQRGSWQKQPWTYPDYQQPEFHKFFSLCRDDLLDQLRQG